MKQSLHDSLDGSHTVFSNKYNAHYHSIYGALDESIHVFIMAGLYYFQRQNKEAISILEMGFGTGLNAYLSFIESKRYGLTIDYSTLESDPIEDHIVQTINYPSVLNFYEEKAFKRMHACEWNTSHNLAPEFIFTKFNCRVEDFNSDSNFDLIYYDAFAPSCQKELWEIPIHKKLHDLLNPGGILVTYCTQGQFKRNLKEIGYSLDILNGPGKKREMLRAIKSK